MGYRYNSETGELEDDGLGDSSDHSGYGNLSSDELTKFYLNDPTIDWSGYGNLTSDDAKALATAVANNETAAGMGPAYFAKLLNSGKALFTNSSGGIDYGKLLTAGAGFYGASRPNTNTQKSGYQGAIPKYVATRNAPAAGQQISGNVTYTAKAKGGLLESGGFVVPADVVSHLGNGSSEAGLRLLADRFGATPIRGEGDGMSDSIKTTIDGHQPARVANEEARLTKDQVEAAGGAKKLYAMMDKIRHARTGSKEQGKQIDPNKYVPGGSVQSYNTGGTTGTSTLPAGTIGTESSLSNWAGDYVTGMLGKGQALSEMPYEQYQGALTAGPSALQTQAFGQASNLQVPASIGQAASTAGDIAQSAQGLGYTPTQFGNQFQAPAAYQTGTFGTDTFGAEQAQQYMNPYLQASLAPQLAEARRQSDISRLADAGRLTKAGAFGGSRQAIMESEGQRNLGTKLADITGQGYNTAYQQAMTQFNADQARKQAAQTATEQSRQFGAGQGLTSAQAAAQYGLAGQQASEASKQFGANYGLQGLNTALQAAQAQGAMGAQEGQLSLANLNALSGLGATQQGLEAQKVAADKAAFEEARANPYKMVQFQQSLLSGLPLAAQSYTQAPTDNLTQFAQSAATVDKLLAILGQTPTTTPVKP